MLTSASVRPGSIGRYPSVNNWLFRLPGRLSTKLIDCEMTGKKPRRFLIVRSKIASSPVLTPLGWRSLTSIRLRMRREAKSEKIPVASSTDTSR